ncbi:hypothetical protein [Rathayibacter sp. AY1B7]|uniref:hypothetical protein n=1 Tax=Rathayibacter sp. AY1B7 TaxID=2080532 RepID=UPI0011B0402D|nr:hypothetical protein [Rathayibacter sp. AY1B7]
MGLTDSERSALIQMFDTAEDLDRWRLRAQRVEEPERGSELAIDDEIFPQAAISQTARISLVSSGEHLRLALDALNARSLYPSAHFTVLRGALVGASQAVWMLAPEERSARRERGLTVSAEMYEQMRRYYNFLGSTGLSAEDRARLGSQQLWLSERSRDVETLRATKAKLDLTAVIGAAADQAFHDPAPREAVRRLWREMSADAHVLGWSLYQRSSFGSADRRTGVGEGKAGGVPEFVAQPFLASYRILERGWSLFDRLCEAP